MEKKQPKIVGYIAMSTHWCVDCIDQVDKKFPRWKVTNAQFYDFIPLCSACEKPLDVRPSLYGLMWVGEVLADRVHYKVDKRTKRFVPVVEPARLERFLEIYGEVGKKWLQTALRLGYVFLENTSPLSLAKGIVVELLRDLFKRLRRS